MSGNSKCLCSETYPVEEPDAQSYCISNNDLQLYQILNPYVDNPVVFAGQYRFAGTLVLPQFVTDFNLGTYWASETAASYFSITIPFSERKQVNIIV